MTKFRTLLVAAAIAIGVPAVVVTDNPIAGEAKSASAAATADCNVVRWYHPNGGLVCFDKSVNRFDIWVPGAYWGAIQANPGQPVTTATGTYSAASWSACLNCNPQVTSLPGLIFVTIQGTNSSGNHVVGVNGGGHDYLEWFAADPNYVLGIAP